MLSCYKPSTFSAATIKAAATTKKQTKYDKPSYIDNSFNNKRIIEINPIIPANAELNNKNFTMVTNPFYVD